MQFPFANFIANAIKMPNGRVIYRMEKQLKGELMSAFNGIIDQVVKKYGSKKSWDTKASLENLDTGEMDDAITKSVKKSLLFGGKYRVKKDKLGRLGIDFALNHPLATDYLNTDAALRLAKMAETTKESIRPILSSAVANGNSPQELAKLLRDDFGFSETRAELISIHEVGDAYEAGNFIPLQEVQDLGYTVSKKWSTVHDDQVTQECSDNEDEGWIPLDDEFSSGDLRPKREGNPRCRCTLLTETQSN